MVMMREVLIAFVAVLVMLPAWLLGNLIGLVSYGIRAGYQSSWEWWDKL